MIVFMRGTPLLVPFACREMIAGAVGCRHRRSFPRMAEIIRELSFAAELSAREALENVGGPKWGRRSFDQWSSASKDRPTDGAGSTAVPDEEGSVGNN